MHTDLLVVSRALCSFRRITLSSGSRNAIKAELLKAKRESVSDYDVCQIVQDPVNRKAASVWTWTVADDLDLGQENHSIVSLPETLAREPMQEGRRLVQCLEGVEGQIWQDGALIASRWWQQEPDQGQWITFLRSARQISGEEETMPPPVQDVPWRSDLPVLRSTINALQAYATPVRLLFMVGIIFGAMVLYNGAQYLHYVSATKGIQAQINARKGLVSEVLKERNRAVQSLRMIDKLGQFGSPLTLLYGVTGILEKVQGKNTKLTKFTLFDNQLTMQITGEPDQDGATLVKKLESDDALENVTVNFKPRNKVEIKGQLAVRPAN